MTKINFIRSYSPNLSELYTISLLRDSFDVRFFMGNKPSIHSELINKYKSLNDLFKFIPYGKYLQKVLYYYGIAAPILNAKSVLEKNVIYNVSDATYFHAYQIAKRKKKYDLKIVMTKWETIPFNYYRNYIRSHISKVVLKNLDGVINITPLSEQASIVENFHHNHCITTPCTVDTNEFKPRDKPSDLCEKYSIKKDDFVLLFVGRVVWIKGIFDILYALQLLIKDSDLDKRRIKLLILGSGKEISNIETLSQKMGIWENVIITGFVPFDKIKHYYNLSDAFILLSQVSYGWNEQLGFSILEAMASGLPVIVNSSGAIHYVTKSAGVKMPVGDYYEVFKSIKQLILDKSYKNKLKEESINVINNYYKPDLIIPNLIKFYKELEK